MPQGNRRGDGQLALVALQEVLVRGSLFTHIGQFGADFSYFTYEYSEGNMDLKLILKIKNGL